MTTIDPPALGFKSYEYYKKELLAWREVTEVSKSKQAIVVALSLPDNNPYQIKEKVFDQMDLYDLKREDGLDVLIQFLDIQLGKDDLTDRIEKFEDFENFKRSDKQSVRDFIASFDFKYRQLKKYDVNIPSEILACKLLRRANISKRDKLLVLTGIDFSNKETMYDKAKQSLRKLFGTLTEERPRSDVKLKRKHEKELVVADVKQVTSGTLKNTRRDACRKWGVQCENKRQMKRKLNPIGKDGKILLCSSCGSYRHLVAKCPDSWENMVKTIANQSNKQEIKGNANLRGREHSGLEEGCNVSALEEVTEEVTRLNEEVRNLKDEIMEIKADNLKELKRQKEEVDNHKKILEQETEYMRITMNELQQRIFKLEAVLETRLINEWKESLTNQEKILVTKLDISLLQTKIENLSKKNKDEEVIFSEKRKGKASGIKEQRLKSSQKQSHNPYTQVTEEDELSKGMSLSRKSQYQVRELNGIQEVVDLNQTEWGPVSVKTVREVSEKEEKKETKQQSNRVKDVMDEITKTLRRQFVQEQNRIHCRMKHTPTATKESWMHQRSLREISDIYTVIKLWETGRVGSYTMINGIILVPCVKLT